MNKYCPAGKIECENFTVHGVPSCLEIKPSARIYHHIEKYDTYCPWPSRQVPKTRGRVGGVQVEPGDFEKEIIDKMVEISAIQFDIGVRQGRDDMKQEIGAAIEVAIENWPHVKAIAIAAIEEVK